MTLDATPDHTEFTCSTLFKSVVQAAVRAWELSGHQCQLQVHVPGQTGPLETVSVPSVHRIEIVVDTAPTDNVWDALAELALNHVWELCALVPQNTLGKAHELLREHGFELQGWWLRDNGAIGFGAVEKA